MRLWKVFSKNFKSNNGNINWKIGEWQKHDGRLKICEAGFHASERIIDAMQYSRANIIARVEVRGRSIKGSDKQVWEEMRIIKAYDWTKENSVNMAIYCAELCLQNFEKRYPDDGGPREAILAAKNWLKNPCQKTANSAAKSASAVKSAAKSAYFAAESADSAAEFAYFAAKSAYFAAVSANIAAESAYFAAYYATVSAAKSAAYNKIEKYILKILKNK
jgi:hypothetical protein